jgi:DNA polymerase-3 subunit chi
MAEVLFYHLTSVPIEHALPELLEKALARGWRVLVRGGSEAGLAALDRTLWTWRDDAFLPHGTSADPHPDRQPVYLTLGDENPNRADVLMLVDGARVLPAEAAGFARTCVLFDGGDEAALAAAREDWRRVRAAGLPARYWAREQGRWVEKAAGS